MKRFTFALTLICISSLLVGVEEFYYFPKLEPISPVELYSVPHLFPLELEKKEEGVNVAVWLEGWGWLADSTRRYVSGDSSLSVFDGMRGGLSLRSVGEASVMGDLWVGRGSDVKIYNGIDGRLHLLAPGAVGGLVYEMFRDSVTKREKVDVEAEGILEGKAFCLRFGGEAEWMKGGVDTAVGYRSVDGIEGRVEGLYFLSEGCGIAVSYTHLTLPTKA